MLQLAFDRELIAGKQSVSKKGSPSVLPDDKRLKNLWVIAFERADDFLLILHHFPFTFLQVSHQAAYRFIVKKPPRGSPRRYSFYELK